MPDNRTLLETLKTDTDLWVDTQAFAEKLFQDIRKLSRQGIRVTVPPQNACTDNAAMIAVVAREKFKRGEFSDFSIDADPNMSL